MRRKLMIIGFGVAVRWRTWEPGSGYDLWDGSGWTPITALELRSYTERGLSVWVNPPWAERG